MRLALFVTLFVIGGCSQAGSSPTGPSGSSSESLSGPAGTSQTAALAPGLSTIGGLDLDGFCRASGHTNATLTKNQTGPGHAHGNWNCQGPSGLSPINMEMACRWQYPGVDPLVAKATDNNDAYTWVCMTR